MYHRFSFVPVPFHTTLVAGVAAGFDFHNPGGPVTLQPQPLPPKVYFAGFNNALLTNAILAR